MRHTEIVSNWIFIFRRRVIFNSSYHRLFERSITVFSYFLFIARDTLTCKIQRRAKKKSIATSVIIFLIIVLWTSQHNFSVFFSFFDQCLKIEVCGDLPSFWSFTDINVFLNVSFPFVQCLPLYVCEEIYERNWFKGGGTRFFFAKKDKNLTTLFFEDKKLKEKREK